MSQENVEVVRRAYEAYGRGDLDGAVAQLTEDCEYVASGQVPGSERAYLGPEGYKRFLASFNEEFENVLVERLDLTPAGEKVLVEFVLRGRGKQSGAEATWQAWQVWTVRDGKLAAGQGFADRAEALEAAGLSE